MDTALEDTRSSQASSQANRISLGYRAAIGIGSGHRTSGFEGTDEVMDSSVNLGESFSYDDATAGKPSNPHNRSLVDIFLSDESIRGDFYPPTGSQGVSPAKKWSFYLCCVVAFIIIFVSMPGGGGDKGDQQKETVPPATTTARAST